MYSFLYGSGWGLSISILGYLFYCALASLVVRIVSSAFKALDGESWFEDYPGKSPREIFLISLLILLGVISNCLESSSISTGPLVIILKIFS